MASVINFIPTNATFQPGASQTYTLTLTGFSATEVSIGVILKFSDADGGTFTAGTPARGSLTPNPGQSGGGFTAFNYLPPGFGSLGLDPICPVPIIYQNATIGNYTVTGELHGAIAPFALQDTRTTHATVAQPVTTLVIDQPIPNASAVNTASNPFVVRLRTTEASLEPISVFFTSTLPGVFSPDPVVIPANLLGGSASLTFTPGSTSGVTTISATGTGINSGVNYSLVINPFIYTITGGSPSCSYVVTPTSLAYYALGGTLNLTITTQTGCAWAISGFPSWLSFDQLSGTGTATVVATALGNAGTTARNGTFVVAGQTVTVSQQGAAPPPCSFFVAPGAVNNAAATGASVIFGVTVSDPACSWMTSNSASWITLSVTGGTGAGSVTVTLASNPFSQPRSAAIQIAGYTIPITQQAASSTGGGSCGNGNLQAVCVANPGNRFASVVSSPANGHFVSLP